MLESLYAAGLLHRCGEFVFATRAATRPSDSPADVLSVSHGPQVAGSNPTPAIATGRPQDRSARCFDEAAQRRRPRRRHTVHGTRCQVLILSRERVSLQLPIAAQLVTEYVPAVDRYAPVGAAVISPEGGPTTR